jgi:hypothetical protein
LGTLAFLADFPNLKAGKVTDGKAVDESFILLFVNPESMNGKEV